MNIFAFVKSKVSILEVVSEYVTLKPAGSYYKGFSPFKNERTPSFTVSPHKEIYYCFSSGQGGDAISFIAKMENCSQIEAAEHLIERYNLEVPKDVEFKNTTINRTAKQSYENICSFFARWCYTMLKQSKRAQAYLEKRKVSSHIIDYFTIGYYPGQTSALKNLLNSAKKENILAQDLIDARIIMDGKHGLYSPFEERIIFPIQDHLGRTCGFGGRIFQKNDSRAKYYNSHDHDFFNKSAILFGLNQAKQSIQKSGAVYLVEGYTDCIAMVQAGYPNSVATLGTSCTAEHLKLLARYAQKLFVVYDGDHAGKQAILRLTKLCWQVNVELSVITLPEGTDPSSFLEKEGTLQPLIGSAQDIFIFFIEQMGERFLNKSMQERLTITKNLLETIGSLSDPLQKDMLLQKAATTLDVPFHTLKQQMGQEKQPAEKAQIPINRAVPALEKNLLSVILSSVGVLPQEDEAFLLEHLPHPLNELLKRYVHHAYDFDLFFSNLSEKAQQFISKIMVESGDSASPETYKKLFAELQKKQWKMMVNNVKIKLAAAQKTTDAQMIKKILTDFQKLKQEMLRRGII